MVGRVLRSRVILVRLVYRIRVGCSVVLKGYSGCVVGGLFRRMFVGGDSLRHVVQVSPLFRGDGRFLLSSPAVLDPSVYGFSASAYFAGLDEMVSLVDQTHVELEGVRCRVEHVEFRPVSVDMLMGSWCPEFFYLNYRTPTVVGVGRSMLRGGRVYGLFPLPVYVFGGLASLWNRIVGEESLRIDIKRYLEWVRRNMFVVPPCKLSSYTVGLDDGRQVSGFVGVVGYGSAYPGSREHRVTVMLARLSEFAGVGLGRRLGFGVTFFREGVVVG
ncbi:MAG: CRISPR system precrRNA processing endoribonuclease RAMP protein Cas6 [Nitrososphaerota archaeon]